jgi:hypothetical protein
MAPAKAAYAATVLFFFIYPLLEEIINRLMKIA